MAEVQFIVEGRPVPEPRKRVQIRYRGGKPYPHHYVDSDTGVNAYKAAVAIKAKMSLPPGWSLEGPMACRVIFVMPRAEDDRRAGRNWCLSRLDVDNLFKGFLDSVKGILWGDDAQVVDVHASKVYASKGEKPHTQATVWHAEPMMED